MLTEAREQVMRYPKLTAARASFVLLALGTVLGGCVADTRYPSRSYSYSYPDSYYYGRPYNRYSYNQYSYSPYYSREYHGYYGADVTGGAGDR
jgi:hypothetical protein